MLIGILKQEICIYERKVESYLIKTNECLFNLKEKSPDLEKIVCLSKLPFPK
jgi:hypothetical protein